KQHRRACGPFWSSLERRLQPPVAAAGRAETGRNRCELALVAVGPPLVPADRLAGDGEDRRTCSRPRSSLRFQHRNINPMQNPRALGLLAVVALLAGTVCYLAVGGGTDRAPGPGATAASARESGGAAVQPAQGQAAPEAQAPEGAGREALAPAAPSGAMLVGRVVDENGAPIAGALVACTASLNPDPRELEAAASEDPARLLERARERLSQRREATTGPDGAFRVAAVAGGRTVSVSARARAFQVTTKQAARPTDADVDLGAVVRRRGAVVSGRVVDRANVPVAGAQVSRRNKDEPRGIDGFNLQGSLWGPGGELFELMRGGQGEVTTDADGRFELANAQPGEFALRARHAEHPTLRREGLTVAAGAQPAA